MQPQSSPQPVREKKTLILRLSSLGDVILSSATLTPGMLAGPVDWVVASEFSQILRGHPSIRRLWCFSRGDGLLGWLRLCSELCEQQYDEVIDLHGSLRTRIARFYFFLRGGSKVRWKRISKQRWRLYGLYLFKNKWPESWKPGRWVERFARFVGGSGTERPDLRHLLAATGAKGGRQDSVKGLPSEYYCVMPSSKWGGKCWAPEKFLAVIQGVRAGVPVILGAGQDAGSAQLVRLLQEKGLAHVSGVGKWDLLQVAHVLAGARAYLGNDTGLAHLAEALGVPALVIYGPTAPEMGFGPWQQRSRAVGLEALGCRPCGKDGRRCYRLTQRYLCMKGLEAEQVGRKFREMGEEVP